MVASRLKFSLPSTKVGGFTLVEILLVIALIGLMAGMVVGGLAGFFQAGKIHPPDRRLKEAVLKARSLAERESKPVFLSYEKKMGGVFIINSSQPFELQLDETGKGNAENAPEIKFLAVVENSPFNYSSDQLVLERVEFFAGCSPAFKTKISSDEKEREILFDPFSAYPLADEFSP